jgi:ADP-heptose:LPS heptosyltransferase
MKKKTAPRKTSSRRHPHTECRHFTGYKPCFPDARCTVDGCAEFSPIGKRILLVNLDAMGNVIATTSILPALKRKYPVSTVTWLTEKNTAPLLQFNPLVDRIMVWNPENLMILGQMKFDVALNVDKSRRSGAFMMQVKASRKMGFGMNMQGQIIPLNREARENYELGLDDHLKFRVNTKTVPQLECEEFGLKFRRDGYILNLSDAEREFCGSYARERGLDRGDLIVGFNTGCSELYPNKKMTVEQHVEIIHRLRPVPRLKMILLGGPEDTERNAEIVRQVGDAVISTPTNEGVRRGLCYINLADVVISGDSFGMHASIGLKKHVIVWFGVSCAPEIDLFDRGIKLVPEGLECSPCWKKSCPYGLECIKAIDIDRIVGEVERCAREFSGR